MAKSKRKSGLRLSGELERALIHGTIVGAIDPEILDPEELSKAGAAVRAAVAALRLENTEPVLSGEAIALFAQEVLGVPQEALRPYLQAVMAENAGSDAATILRKLRDKQTLVDLLNAASTELQRGTVDVGAVRSMLEQQQIGETVEIKSLAERLNGGIPEQPVGPSIESLPGLTEKTGGLIGMWAIGGEPGLGKSTLAYQISLDIGRTLPVLYYDLENGFQVMAYRTSCVFGHDIVKVRDITKQLYLRDSIRTLDRDLRIVEAPAVIVVDSVQKLPTSYDNNRRSGLDRWVHRLEALKKRGYLVVLISEVGRAQYQQGPYIGSFKETGEIEYAADAGLQLIQDPSNQDRVAVHIVKNRHRPHKGLACYLSRVNDWWWKEYNVGTMRSYSDRLTGL